MEPEKETPETPPAGPGAAPAAAPPKPDEKKALLLNIYAQLQLFCPECGEMVVATDKESTEDGTLELELTPDNGYRFELPKVDGTCDACKIPVYREKLILFYQGKRPA